MQLSIAWVHRRRRYVSRPYRWEPTITDPNRGLIKWTPGSEQLKMITTLYRSVVKGAVVGASAVQWEDKVRR
jgi:hypothetical protein